MQSVPRILGQKFVFSRVNNAVQANVIKQSVGLLNKARISHRISACAANGLPLNSETNQKYFKEIFLDTGLCCASLGLNLNQISTIQDILLISQGEIAEQVVGQLLRTINPSYIEPALYYWQREEKNSNAEVDYIIQQGHRIIPIEVKAGNKGKLKSLHLFMQLKKSPLALRINSDIASKVTMNVKTQMGEQVSYTLISLPFYLIEQIPRILCD